MESSRHLPDDPSYPSALLDPAGPEDRPRRALHTRGRWPAPEGVAIVGTRHPTAEAEAFTRILAAAIVGEGWAVWSGGAKGIDAAAHEGALERGGVTVAVIPNGLDAPYPKANADLFARVLAAGGTLVSPQADGGKPLLGAFHRRNAVLAALTFATIVVQAGEKSGARSTARSARALGRPLWVVPQPPWEERGRGCALELAMGARLLVSEDALVKELRALKEKEPREKEKERAGREQKEKEKEKERVASRACERAEVLAREHVLARTLQELDEETTRVLGAISEVPIHMDDLCERASLPIRTVAAALLTLTLGAVVVEAPAGHYRRLPSI